MKKSFLLIRYFLYYSLLISPFFNPAVVVLYDLPMFFICFIAVPFEVYLAFRLSSARIFNRGFFSLKGGDYRKFILSLVFPFLILINPSYYPYIVFSVSFSAAAFFTTYFLFRFNAVFISFIEALFYFLIYYRLIGFSSSLSMENPVYSYVSAFYFILLVFSYFLISFFYYREKNRYADPGEIRRSSDFRREKIFMLLFFLLFSVTVFIFLPDGSRTLDFILNFSNEKVLPEGGGTSGAEDEEGSLKGVPSDRWGNRSRRGGSGSKQYAVMVVASGKREIYSAWDYLGRFDPVKGFLFSEDEPLNNLRNEKFIENWINPDFPYDAGRDIVSTFYLSAIPERSVPYLPFLIEPTVYDTSVSPFSYSYTASSFISVHSADSIPDGWELTAEDEISLSEYLYSEIDPEYESVFTSYIDSLDLDGLPPGKRIHKILTGFKNHQYEIGYDENTSLDKLSKFLSGDLTGDCTEFANTAAVLGRLAGIPSRVVRGYLASENLQTPSHRRGIIELQKNIDALKEYSPEELILVTTAHKHAWVQFYLADYGWIDFETTGYAIPPSGMNMNDAQVVVPIIRTIEGTDKKNYIKGFLVVLKLLAFTVILLILLLYIYKISKIIYLEKSSGQSEKDYISRRYRYILLKHFLFGYPLKKKYMTAVEYSIAAWKRDPSYIDTSENSSFKEPGNSSVDQAETYEVPDRSFALENRNSEFRKLSDLYTELIYRESYTDGEYDDLMKRYKISIDKVKDEFKKSGIKMKIKAFLSLRGIFY